MEVVAAEREARSKEREGLMEELGERQRQWDSDKLRSDNELVRQVRGHHAPRAAPCPAYSVSSPWQTFRTPGRDWKMVGLLCLPSRALGPRGPANKARPEHYDDACNVLRRGSHEERDTNHEGRDASHSFLRSPDGQQPSCLRWMGPAATVTELVGTCG